MKKQIPKLIVGIIAIGLLGWFLSYTIPQFKEREPITYNLDLLYENYYVIMYRVSSNVPASNYDVAEYCINGNTYTLTGDVNISYTDDIPRVVIGGTGLVHGTRATFYIPKDGVKREAGVGLK